MSRVAKENERSSKDAKKAELIYKVEKAMGEGRYLLSVRLLTGRHHQIRVQLSNAGIPIMGDRKYGDPSDDYRGGLCLSCSRLEFRHPKSGEMTDLEIVPGFV